MTSGIRFGTPAITTRGLKEHEMIKVVELIDRVIKNHDNVSEIQNVKKEVNELMSGRALFNY